MNRDEFMDWINNQSETDGYDDALAFFNSYSTENEHYRESSEARFKEFTDTENEMKASIDSLKARNYDLLMQVPANEPIKNQVDTGGEVYHIDSLFKDV